MNDEVDNDEVHATHNDHNDHNEGIWENILTLP